MKIIDKTRRPDVVELIDIEACECFKVVDSRFDNEDAIFIRTNVNVYNECNAVCLNDGVIECFPSDTECILVDVELIVTHKK